MPYDDQGLSEFAGYFEAKEPGRRERASAWATAIGLQQVDGLVPSRYLVETAKAHIEGKITQDQARRRIRDYYSAKQEGFTPDPQCEEPDKAAERIAAIVNDGAFVFTPEYFINLHKKIFSGIFSHAGKLRTVNIRKHEWVLKDASVTYGSADTLKDSLVRDFADERGFDYGSKSIRAIIPHFARFIAQIWQVHPFMEGNTRATAVFAIKYLQWLGYRVSNNMFVENAWYFRNALVRANYADYATEVRRDWSFLETFFRNLLLGENNELKSRTLLVGYKAVPEFESGKKKVVRKSGKKTAARLLELLRRSPEITFAGMVAKLGISRSAIQKHIAALKAEGRLRRVGSDRSGHWEVGWTFPNF